MKTRLRTVILHERRCRRHDQRKVHRESRDACQRDFAWKDGGHNAGHLPKALRVKTDFHNNDDNGDSNNNNYYYYTTTTTTPTTTIKASATTQQTTLLLLLLLTPNHNAIAGSHDTLKFVFQQLQDRFEVWGLRFGV